MWIIAVYIAAGLPWWFRCLKKKKNVPVKQETQIRSLGSEDLLEKGMATHSSILTWRTPWTEEPGGLQSVRSQKSRTQLSDYNKLSV